MNFPLLSALVAMLMAQVIKAPLQLVARRTWNPGLCFSTGGMPSSHSAAAAALAASVGIVNGFGSSLFAIAAVVCTITAYDAAGIRRHAGMHAVLLNRITHHLPESARGEAQAGQLKELLGHRPLEVMAGLILGVLTSVTLNFIL
ncbi:divergent PAP2 family protein [Paenibacillus sp. MMS20-IR301]|uniref:divergent PAP2 family protein n=1 Tax=Paenibacillus sp. MMS20-IR301 TaxID=2895946 RepID=UPI0028E51C20|nr:divergent PAP2 family protein [Paenibacillus sp. MMS20-IR301]WNS45303.1 divergent PAP2 family protein [Paenibacillus sp. MMS20-IR301]